MPSYLVSGKEAFVPTQLYQPDFGAIATQLRIKQSQYDKGFDQIKSAHTSIINSQVTSEENQAAKQEYLRTAENRLKSLADADLSLPENVSLGESVFKPFYEDMDIVADMMKTKQYNKEIDNYNRLKTSSKLDDQAQYWDMGAQYVQNGINQLRTAKRGDGSIQGHQTRRYVPFVDIQKYLDDSAKDEGLKITRETSTGQYKLTRINGDEAVPLFEMWAKSKLGNNNKVNDMFRVEGTVLFENSVQHIMSTNGVDVNTAKTIMAEEYLGKQAANYKKNIDNLTSHEASLKTKIEQVRVELTTRPTEANRQKLEELLQNWDLTKNNIESYDKLHKKFTDKSSNDYQTTFNSILNNGEAFFAMHSRENFIGNWAKGRASNSSVTYDIDPGYKLSMELEKAMTQLQWQKAMNDADNATSLAKKGLNPDGTPATGTGSGLSSAEQKTAQLNTPTNVGLNVYGKDAMTTYQRFIAKKDDALNGFLKSGLKFIDKMSFEYSSSSVPSVPSDYLREIEKQVRSNDITQSPELEAQHKKLQEAGIIPKDVAYGQGPTKTYNAIRTYYANIVKEQLKNGTAKPELLDLLDAEAREAQTFYTLKEMEDAGMTQLRQHPVAGDLIKADKTLKNESEFYNDKFGTATGVDLYNRPFNVKGGEIRELMKQGLVTYDVDKGTLYMSYRKAKGAAPNYITVDVSGDAFGLSQKSHPLHELLKAADKEKSGASYSRAQQVFKDEFGKTAIGKDQESFISNTLMYEAGDANDATLAKDMTKIVMGSQNYSEQVISEDGVGPANIKQLTDNGASAGEVKEFLRRIQGNASDLISRVGVTKIGENGKPSVRLFFKQDKIDAYSKGDDKVISPGTANALGGGVEIAITDPTLFQQQGLDMDFTPNSLDMMIMQKKGRIEAPAVLKDAGFDYVIEPNYDKTALQVKFLFKKFENGTFVEQPAHTEYIPLQGSSLESIRKNLFTTAMQIYTGNKQRADQFYKQNPQVQRTDIDELLKQYNYK